MVRSFGVVSVAVALLGLVLVGLSWRQTGVSQTARADQLEAEFSQSTAHSEVLQSDLQTSEIANVQLAAGLVTLEEEFARVKADRDALAQEVTLLASDRDELSSHIVAQSAQRESLAEQRDAANDRTARLTKRIRVADGDVDLLTDRLSLMMADKKSLATALGGITGDGLQLQQIIAGADGARESLARSDAFSQWQAEMVTAGIEPGSASSTLAEAQSGLAGAQADLVALTRDYGALDDRATDQTAKIDELEAVIGLLSGELSVLTGQNTTLNREQATLSTLVSEAQDERDKLTHQLTQAADEQGVLGAELSASIEQSTAREERTAEQTDTLIAERDALENELVNVTIERDNLRDVVVENQTVEDSAEERVAVLRAERDALSATLTRLGDDLGVGSDAESGALFREIEGFKRQVSDLNADITKATQQQVQALADNQRLTADIVVLTGEITTLKQSPEVALVSADLSDATELAVVPPSQAPPELAPSESADSDHARVFTALRDGLFADLLKSARPAAGPDAVDSGDAGDGGQVIGDRLVFENNGLFEQGSAQLSQDGQDLLGRIAPLLIDLARASDVGVTPANWILRVEGHTDATPIVSSAHSSNLDLSIARAKSVVDYLDGRGVSGGRLAVAGFGANRPLLPGDDPASLARNRRVEFVLIDRES